MNAVKTICSMLLPLMALAALALLPVGCAESITVRQAPPPLPVYEQPYCPGPGYIWAPGYWAYGQNGYFWVPGSWEPAPGVGYLWTPGYWGCSDGMYYWHSGYWGRHIGYYGGINYGYGYSGMGYEGGYWRGGAVYYNTAVTRVNVTVVNNTYAAPPQSKTVAVAAAPSYNGGAGGAIAKPTSAESAAASEPHVAPTPHQNLLIKSARSDPRLLASANHGQPHPDLIAKKPVPDQAKANLKQHPKKKQKVKKPEQPKRPEENKDPERLNTGNEKDGGAKNAP